MKDTGNEPGSRFVAPRTLVRATVAAQAHIGCGKCAQALARADVPKRRLRPDHGSHATHWTAGLPSCQVASFFTC